MHIAFLQTTMNSLRTIVVKGIFNVTFRNMNEMPVFADNQMNKVAERLLIFRSQGYTVNTHCICNEVACVFQGSTSFVDPFCYLCFMFVFVNLY